ncbi:hypothetical protein NQ318_000677 [Aromia moschata]|uniref:CHK kinase-like domain-containing protein n=1 Tax=Aromia moschata TaxID=1265417 RepID=A0AAV8XY25_9CUCU|nr:hypothetical protein NQ318_000677 [Aromia moschata]
MDDMEVLILNNLKKIGYELYDRVKPLNLSHQKAVLKEYGKLHAVSFALRDQHPDQFRTLINSKDFMRGFFALKGIQKSVQKAVNEAMDIFREKGDFTLAEKLERIFYKNPGELALDLFRMDKDNPEAVILHGDCWNNNFMYKYENHDRLSPSKVMILDWQLSAIRSPVFDLSYFIYATASSEGVEQFDELMELGSDPEKLFPFSALRTHWRKYALYGLIFTIFILKFGLCEKEDAPELADLAEDDDMGDFLNVTLKNKDLYYERLRPAISTRLRRHFEGEIWQKKSL